MPPLQQDDRYPAPLPYLPVQQPFQPPHHQPWYPTAYSHLFSGPLPSSSADLLSSLSRWSLGPPDFLLPYHTAAPVHAQYEYAAPEPVGFSPAPSDSSILSWDADSVPTPPPGPTHVVCNAPLVAPVPLPYHSPTFLQYDLPDDDEDLSHPPYTRRPHKRKRAADEDADETRTHANGGADGMAPVPAKRRSIVGLHDPRAPQPRGPRCNPPRDRLALPAASSRHVRAR